MALQVEQVRAEFAGRFGRPAVVVARAPGRVNLIGEHTDYNEGFVLPMALEQSTWVAAAERGDGRVRVWSCEMGAEHSWLIEDPAAGCAPAWANYIAGVAVLLRRRGVALHGADLLVRSDVPVGGGLSSSAALESALHSRSAHSPKRRWRVSSWRICAGLWSMSLRGCRAGLWINMPACWQGRGRRCCWIVERGRGSTYRWRWGGMLLWLLTRG